MTVRRAGLFISGTTDPHLSSRAQTSSLFALNVFQVLGTFHPSRWLLALVCLRYVDYAWRSRPWIQMSFISEVITRD